MDKTYTVNTKKKVITISNSAKLTTTDKEIIAMYLNVGYILRQKSVARAKKAAERADSITDADIKKALEEDKEALEKYCEIKNGNGKGKGFFAAKKWYNDNYKKKEKKKEN